MSKVNLEVIDQFFSAQLSANESEATLKALRPQVEQAVDELLVKHPYLRMEVKRTLKVKR